MLILCQRVVVGSRHEGRVEDVLVSRVKDMRNEEFVCSEEGGKRQQLYQAREQVRGRRKGSRNKHQLADGACTFHKSLNRKTNRISKGDGKLEEKEKQSRHDKSGEKLESCEAQIVERRTRRARQAGGRKRMGRRGTRPRKSTAACAPKLAQWG